MSIYHISNAYNICEELYSVSSKAQTVMILFRVVVIGVKVMNVEWSEAGSWGDWRYVAE